MRRWRVWTALALMLAAVLMVVLLAAGCRSLPPALSGGKALSDSVGDSAGTAATESKAVAGASAAIKAQLPAVKKVAPAPAGKIAGQTQVLDASAERLNALAAQLQAQGQQVKALADDNVALQKQLADAKVASDKAVALLQKQIADLKADTAGKVKLFLYAVAGASGLLGTVGIFLAIYLATQRRAGIALAAAGYVGAAFWLTLIQYGKPIFMGLAILMGAVVIGAVAYLAYNAIRGNLNLAKVNAAIIQGVEATGPGSIVKAEIARAALESGVADALHAQVQTLTEKGTK